MHRASLALLALSAIATLTIGGCSTSASKVSDTERGQGHAASSVAPVAASPSRVVLSDRALCSRETSIMKTLNGSLEAVRGSAGIKKNEDSVRTYRTLLNSYIKPLNELAARGSERSDIARSIRTMADRLQGVSDAVSLGGYMRVLKALEQAYKSSISATTRCLPLLK